MKIYAATALINSGVAFAIGSGVFLKNPRDPRYRTFLLFNLAIIAWSVPYFFWQTSATPSQALLFSRLLMAGAIFVPVTYFHHTCAVMRIRQKTMIRLGYLVSLLFVALDMTPSLVKSVSPKLGFPYWPDPGPAFHPFLAIFLFFIVRSTILIINKIRVSSGTERNQYLYILVAQIVGWGGGATNFPLWYNIPIPPIGNGLVAVYALIFAYAMLRYRLMDITLLTRDAAVHLLTSLVTGGLGGAGVFLLTQSAAAAGFVLVFSCLAPWGDEPVRRWARGWVNRTKLGEADRYLDAVREKMAPVRETAYTYEALARSLVEAVVNTFPIETASVYFLDERRRQFVLQAQRGLKNPDARDLLFNRESLALPDNDPLIQAMTSRKGLLVRDDLTGFAEGAREAGGARTLERIEGEAAAPFLFLESVKGLLVVGPKQGHRMYHQKDLEALYAYSRLGEELMRYIMGMEHELENTALYSHDMANDVKSLLQALEFLCSPLAEAMPPDDRSAVLSQAAHTARRMNRAFQDHRDRSKLILKSMRGDYPREPMDITQVLRESCAKFELEAGARGVSLLLRLADEPATVNGNAADLARATDNLLGNALRCVSKGGRVILEGASLNGSFRATVQDDGQGIDPENLERIWEFGWQGKNSQAGASGLGLFFVRKIIELHNGKVWAESSGRGQGARFLFLIPLAASHSRTEEAA